MAEALGVLPIQPKWRACVRLDSGDWSATGFSVPDLASSAQNNDECPVEVIGASV
jgi:hypothetical protein